MATTSSASSPDGFDPERADRVQHFIERLCKHTKGRFARSPFILADWQRDEVVRPLFGTVRHDDELDMVVRRYRIAWIELARKQGKSQLLAAIALYLLCGDGEEGSEVYGAAKDRDQARKVYDVAERMVQLSPTLSKRLIIKSHEKRIIDPKTASYYQVIAADAAGNLGHNPHGVIFDEVITQPSADLWNALRTAMGTREQPLMVAATTAGNDPASFAAQEHAYCERVADDPLRDPTRFVYMRNMPRDADWTDIRNYAFPNPGMGDFFSAQSVKDEIAEAKEEPTKENAVRQFRGNQWVQNVTRWMPLHLWDKCAGLVDEEQLRGRRCFGGLDLSSKVDLTALAWVFPDDANAVVWRAWVPESQLTFLDQHTGGQASVWVRRGFLRLTEGSVVDYDELYRTIDVDRGRFKVMDISHDRWMAEPIVQELAKRKLHMFPVGQGYVGMSEPMKELMRWVKTPALNHGGNPVARWNADAIEARQDPAENIKPDKPDREMSGKRIDLMVALIMAIDGVMRRGTRRTSRAAGF